jgi:hypothetical protein
VRDVAGDVVFRDTIPFLPQDNNLTSVGVVKLPDGLTEQLGLVGFFYPTVSEGHSGAFFSMYPDLIDPLLTFNVWKGDLGLNEGVPRSVYALDTSNMTKLTGQKTFNSTTQNPLLSSMEQGVRALNNLEDAFDLDDPDAMLKEWNNIFRSMALSPSMAAPAVLLNMVKPVVGLYQNATTED